jgi:hypothetical protein
MKDCEGWPIVPGARVRVTLPNINRRVHAAGCLQLDCGCPSYPVARHGVVKRIVEQPASGRPYVEIQEFETFNTLTPAPSSVRVMRGKIDAQRRHEMMTADGKREYKRRKQA